MIFVLFYHLHNLKLAKFLLGILSWKHLSVWFTCFLCIDTKPITDKILILCVIFSKHALTYFHILKNSSKSFSSFFLSLASISHAQSLIPSLFSSHVYCTMYNQKLISLHLKSSINMLFICAVFVILTFALSEVLLIYLLSTSDENILCMSIQRMNIDFRSLE